MLPWPLHEFCVSYTKESGPLCTDVLLEFGGDGGGMLFCEGSQTLHRIFNALQSWQVVTLERCANISMKQQLLHIC